MLERIRFAVFDAFRELRASPSIPAVVIITLGAAIGMNAAIFSLVDRALLSPPGHLHQPARLFTLTFQALGEPEGRSGMTTSSYVTYRTVRDQVPGLAGAAAWRSGPQSVVIDGHQIAAETKLVSGNYFEVLGATPQIGRGIRPEDESAQSTTAVLSHAFWTSAYRGDPGILGRQLTVQGISYTIGGVMPRGFSGHSAASVDAWIPITTALRADAGWDEEPMRNIVSIVVRVAEGGSVRTAAERTSAALARRVDFRNLAGAEVSGSTQRVAFWLAGVSLLVFVIGLANAGTLLLVRAARRRRASAIRAALGAARGRLVAQVIIEAVVISTAATVASLVMGYWLDEAVRRILLPDISRSGGLQPRAQLAAALAGLVTATVAVASGAWSLPSGVRPAELKDPDGVGRAWLQRVLLVIQTTVCVALLAGAGMFARSLQGLLGQDFGMQMHHVLLVDFEEGAAPLPQRDEILSDALQRVRGLPGVQAATIYQSLPFSGHHVPPISVPGRAEPPNVDGQLPFLIAATPELFDLLEIAVVDGRRFIAADDPRQPVVVVNESMARVTWPGERAVGKCIRAGFDPSWDPSTATGPPTASTSLPCREVIGVVRDVRQRQVVPAGDEERLLQYYVPFSQVPGPPGDIDPGPRFCGLLVQTAGDPSRLIGPIRRLVTSGRAGLPFLRVRPYVELLERQVQPWRLGSALLAIFSALAVGVAATGIFAAFTHAVTLRRREMAIRIAVGARPDAVVTMILREAVRLAAIGIGIGGVCAYAGGRSLQSVLYGIAAADAMALAGATTVMLGVVLAATIVPARRASKADPNSLLRAE